MKEVSRRRERDATFRELAGRLFEGALTLPSLRRVSPDGRQILPVNMYETDQDLMIVAPVPGVHPEDVEVTVRGNTLTIRTGNRGSLEETKNYVRHEWHYGPYARVVTLPFQVDPEKANARLGNGILTLAMPKSATSRTKTIRLQRIAPAEGESAGHGAVEFAPEEHQHSISRTTGRRRKTPPLG